MKMSNLSLEELEEAQNLLLDAYNIIGAIPVTVSMKKLDKLRILMVFNDTEAFLEKMGVNLVY
jgi:hypothetical protein